MVCMFMNKDYLKIIFLSRNSLENDYFVQEQSPSTCIRFLGTMLIVKESMMKNLQVKKKTKFKKIVADFLKKSVNEEFWNRFFEIERLSSMKLNDDEAFVIITRNQQTGEERRYEGVHLKKSIRKIAN